MALFSVTEQPTPFGAFDDDDHFIEDANAMLLYIRSIKILSLLK